MQVDERNINRHEQTKWLDRLTKNATRLTPKTPEKPSSVPPTFVSEKQKQTDEVVVKRRARRRKNDHKEAPKVDPIDEMLSGLSIQDLNSLTELTFGDKGTNIFREMDIALYKKPVLPKDIEKEQKWFDLSKYGKVTSDKDLSNLLSRVPMDSQHVSLNNMGISDGLIAPVKNFINSSNLLSLKMENNKLGPKSIISLMKLCVEKDLTEFSINNQCVTLGSDIGNWNIYYTI